MVGRTSYNENQHTKTSKIWQSIRIGNILKYIKGRKPYDVNLKYGDGYLPYLSTEYLRNGEKTLYAKISEGIVKVNDGDIILLWDGSNAGEFFIGKEGILSSTMVKIQFNEQDIDSVYLFYTLKMRENILRGHTRGTGIPHVDKEVFENLEIPLPPLPEQQKIAEILSTVDEVIEKVDKAIEKTERLKKGLMQGLLSGKLKVVESNGQLRLKIRDAKEFGISPIGEIPKEWKVVKLEDIISACENGIWGEEPIPGDIAYPVIRSTEITHDGKIDTTNVAMRRISGEKLPKFSLQNGDIILVASSGSSHLIGRAALFQMQNNGKIYLFSNFMLRIRPKNINSKFLFYYLKSSYYQRFLKYLQQTSTGLKNLPKKEFIKFKLPNPPLSEQEKIAEVIQNIDRRLELFNNKRLKFEKIKQQLMNDLLTGKRRVKL